MNKVIKRMQNLMLGSLGVPLLNVIVGLIFIVGNRYQLTSTIVVLAALLAVEGLFYIIRYLYDGLGKKVFAIDLIVGVVGVILGAFTYFYLINNTSQALESIGIILGLWFITIAVEKIYFGIKFAVAQEEIYPLVWFIGILIAIMGLLVIFNPFSSFMLITRLMGLFTICVGLLDGMTSMLFRRRSKEILKLFK